MKIITISREFGSGGRELGKRLADLSHSFWRFWIAMLVLTLLIAVFGVYGPGIDMRQFVYFQF